jgi:peroxiredoxin Q/BCP
MATMPAAGDPAPDFALPDDSGAIHCLGDQRGRWTVVYFYPRDETPGCTAEACAFRDANDDLVAAGATVWGISPDDAASHQRFRARHGLPFPLLVDGDHAVAESYGAWVEKVRNGSRSMGVQRSTFLVGPDGRIAHAWHRVSPDGHADEVAAALDAARRDGPG